MKFSAVPSQIGPLLVSVNVGIGFTVSVELTVLVHPSVLVPVIVYTVDVEGLAFTVFPTVPESAVAGAQA